MSTDMSGATPRPWKWVECAEPTHSELICAEFDVGEADSILYHGADWPITNENKALIVRAVNNEPLLAEAVDLLKDCITVKNMADGKVPLVSNQGQWMDCYTELAEYRSRVEKARAILARIDGDNDSR